MPKYIVEREIDGVGNLTSKELKDISQTSCRVLNILGPEIQWVHSYVTVDKLYCVYNSSSEEMIQIHAEHGKFPINSINKVITTIDPTSAE